MPSKLDSDVKEQPRGKFNLVSNSDISLQSEKSCDKHDFIFLRQETRDVRPGVWHGDVWCVDIFYCTHCLAYMERAGEEMTYEQHVFRSGNK